MSEKQEKRKRRIQKARYNDALNLWHCSRPPMILFGVDLSGSEAARR